MSTIYDSSLAMPSVEIIDFIGTLSTTNFNFKKKYEFDNNKISLIIIFTWILFIAAKLHFVRAPLSFGSIERPPSYDVLEGFYQNRSAQILTYITGNRTKAADMINDENLYTLEQTFLKQSSSSPVICCQQK